MPSTVAAAISIRLKAKAYRPGQERFLWVHVRVRRRSNKWVLKPRDDHSLDELDWPWSCSSKMVDVNLWAYGDE